MGSRTKNHIKKIYLILLTTIILTSVINSYAIVINNPVWIDEDRVAAGYLEAVCNKLLDNQNDIQGAIDDNYNSDARLFDSNDISPTLSDFTQILESPPIQLYYTSNCPTINLQLPAIVQLPNGRRIPSLYGKKIKKVATCSTTTGEILKWTGYTNITPEALRTLNHQAYCLNTLIDKNVTLTTP